MNECLSSTKDFHYLREKRKFCVHKILAYLYPSVCEILYQLHLSDQQFHYLLICALYYRFDGMLVKAARGHLSSLLHTYFPNSISETVDECHTNTHFEMGAEEFFGNIDIPHWYPALFLMLKYVSTSMVFVSLIMNGATFMVFSSKQYRHSLDAMLRKFLAVSDATVVLVSDGFHTLSLQISGVSITTYNSITCKIFGTMHLMLRAFSAWILVFIALERVIGICFPHRSKVLNTKRRFMWLLLGISVVIIAFYSPLFWLSFAHHDIVREWRWHVYSKLLQWFITSVYGGLL